MGKDCYRECMVVNRKKRSTRILGEIDIFGMEPSRRNKTHRYSKSLHIWEPLFCRGRYCVARGYGAY